MAPDDSIDPLLKLARRLGELRRSDNENTREAVGRAETALREALAKRDSGDMTGALAQIRQAMQVLATSGGELVSSEGVTLHQITRVLKESLDAGARGDDRERKTR